MIYNQLSFRNAAPARYPLALPFYSAGEKSSLHPKLVCHFYSGFHIQNFKSL